MITLTYNLRHGFVLSLADLRPMLQDLERDGKRWWIEESPTGEAITICHDEISFLVPVVSIGDSMKDESRLMVCLHPELIRPQIEGLYLENGRVLGDFIEDWTRFWEPLKQRLDDSSKNPHKG
ncbi:MAG: hypothetical protein IRZ03_17840 [Acidobacterium ailaaui]|nr:hypothetical protein [Pseudacidobacterium ailaaui]